jgi:hypothetical protein
MSEIIKNKNEIDLSQITIGAEFKNYKQLAQALGEEVCDGNAKKYQMNKWKRYFDFEKANKGQAITITDIYSEPYPTDDARKIKEGLYVKYIELLLLEYLSKQEGQKVELSKQSLFLELGIIGNNYKVENRTNKIIKSDIAYLTDDVCVPTDFEIKHFYQRAYQKINDILKTALRSMRDRRLINYQKNTYIVREDIFTGKTIQSIATDEEEKMLLQAENAILNEMGVATVTQVYLKFKAEEFYERVNEYVTNNYGWLRVYSLLSIIYINDIAQQIPIKAEEIRKLTCLEKKQALNNNIINSLNKQADRKYQDFENSIVFGDESEGNDENDNSGDNNMSSCFSFKSNYVEIQKELANYLIGLNSRSFLTEGNNIN